MTHRLCRSARDGIFCRRFPILSTRGRPRLLPATSIIGLLPSTSIIVQVHASQHTLQPLRLQKSETPWSSGSRHVVDLSRYVSTTAVDCSEYVHCGAAAGAGGLVWIRG